MQQWEYRYLKCWAERDKGDLLWYCKGTQGDDVVAAKKPIAYRNDMITQFGDEGWELVSVRSTITGTLNPTTSVPGSYTDGYELFFKRPKYSTEA